jgi:hypothetical protein
MNELELAKQAAKKITEFKSNVVIMAFVNKQAAEKTAADIREKTGSSTTAKAVELLVITNQQVKARFEEYVNAGLFGCYMASLQA